MKRTCIMLIPTMSGVVFNETIELIESLLGKLNIDVNNESLAFSTRLNLNENQKKTFSDSLEEKGLKTIFIEADENLLDEITTSDTIDLTMCQLKEEK